MTPTLELVSMQYALALLIGQDLELRTMLRKFLPPALKLLNCRSGYIWLHQRETAHPMQPCYSYPSLNAPLNISQPILAAHLQRIAKQDWQVKKPGEIVAESDMHYHFLPLGKTGLLVLLRDPPLPESHLLALGLVLKRLETACLACLQHAYLEEARKEALQAKETAEKASQAKSEFLAMISHEIRTPMNGVIGLTDLMLYSEPSTSQRGYLEMIKSSSTALLDIINEILDFSRIETGTLSLSNAPFCLQTLLQETLTPLKLRATEKTLTLDWHIEPNVPRFLEGDAGRLRQVLINLVGNAIKFTETGDIHITVRRQEPEHHPDTASVCFSVRDTGIGIPVAKQASIFQPFQQADSSIARRYGGTGLGLTISSQLIQMMGGKLQVKSQLGQGSVFHFHVVYRIATPATAPCATQTIPVAPSPRATLHSHKRPLNILLAEDNRVNRLLAVRLLNKAGHQVITAENGHEAVSGWSEQRPDVVLMDMQMPVMDGLEATLHIRRHEQHASLPRTPIIALTANAMHSDREKCLAVGMDDFISKPFNVQELLQVLERSCVT